MEFHRPALWHRISTLLLLGAFSCAGTPLNQPAVSEKTESVGPPYLLTVKVVDDEGRPAPGAYVRVMECCHTQKGPCGRIPVNDEGIARFDVCPFSDGIVRITLTPDPKHYRVPPINEFEVHADDTVNVTVTRHQKVLRYLKKD